MRNLPTPIAVLGVSLILASDLFPADIAGEKNLEPIDALITRLGDKSFRVRQAAGKSLEERGEEALPFLRKAVDDTDEEVSRRAEILTQKIERTVMLTPKRVTLKMKGRTAEEIIKELAKQTGYKLHYAGRAQRMSIDVENVTYWEALDKICDEAGIVPGYDDAQGTTWLYQQDAMSPYTYHTGPFRLVATSFNYARYVNLANIPRRGQNAGNMQENNLNFGFTIQSEPKAPLLSVSQPKLTEAIDENGISLLPRRGDFDGQFQAQYFDGNGLYRNFQHAVNAQLSKPAKDATKAKLIKGTVTVTLLSGTKPDVVIEKLAVGKKKMTAAGSSAEIDLEEVAEQNKTYTLTLHIKKKMKNGEGQDFNWINSIQQKLELIDAKGGRYQSQGITNFIGNSPTSVHATYQFNPPPNVKIGAPVKLVLNQWLTIMHELDFEFKELPLP